MIVLQKCKLVSLVILVFASQLVWGREYGEPDFNSPEFEKRFTGSYGVLSEKEPPLSDLEKVLLKKLVPLMGVNQDYAMTLLESMLVGEEESSATFHYLLGNLYFQNGQYLLSEQEYKEAIDGFPDFQRAWTNLGVLKLRSKDTKAALICFLKAVELGDTQSHTFGMLGYCHYSEGNFVSAGIAYDRAILADPDNTDWLEGKAQVFFEAERYTEAAQLQDEIIAKDPSSVDNWIAQTNSYIAMKDYAKAVRNLEIARTFAKDDFKKLHLLGGLYAKLDMYDSAASIFLEAIPYATSKDVGFLLDASKVLFYQNKQTAEAKRIYKAIKPERYELTADELLEFKILGAEFQKSEGDLDGAITILKEAEELDPLSGKVLLRLAELYSEKDMMDKAYYVLDRAQGDGTVEYDALMIRSKLLLEQQRYKETLVTIAQAMKLKPSAYLDSLYLQVQSAISDQ